MNSYREVGLRVGQVAEKAGVNIQTLRYYERRGLLAQPCRSVGGHRIYPADTVALLGVIKTAQRLGFTLDEVADLLDAGGRRHPSPDLHQRAADKIIEIDAKILGLRLIRDALVRLVDANCETVTDCTCTDDTKPFADLSRMDGQ
ncbi:MerR family transcriptional regulator [Dactylosporangium sp. CA-092794]|uniref:MerR family transcriptional regulator n=1 Tax=Dactylosporangium sp. CA-092794 TaxID=3239929 RepID=UPI003D8E378F